MTCVLEEGEKHDIVKKWPLILLVSHVPHEMRYQQSDY